MKAPVNRLSAGEVLSKQTCESGLTLHPTFQFQGKVPRESVIAAVVMEVLTLVGVLIAHIDLIVGGACGACSIRPRGLVVALARNV